MNVFLLTDVEGIAGVTDIAFMDRSGEKYLIAREKLCQTINLAVQACVEAGAENIYYLDGHGGGGNVYEDRIDARAIKCSIRDWEQLLQNGKIDCQIDLGAHARAGTIGGFLDHTNSSRKWFRHCVNGVEMSELSMHAILCGVYNVPIVGCVGDEAACQQAREYIPSIVTGAVKKAYVRNVAVDYENADEILTATVRKALQNYQNIPVYKIAMPATIELTLYRTDMCEELLANCDDQVERVDARTLRKQVEKIVYYSDLRF